jgi:Na+/H+ antiporter NhaD/arsenite permease-like protein
VRTVQNKGAKRILSEMIPVVLAVFVLTYSLFIFRRIGGRSIPVWMSMAVGAVLMVGTLSISPLDAFGSIDFRVISFLFGMLVITAGFEKSGLIEFIVLSILKRAKSVEQLLFGIVFGSGLLSAFLVNDTIALLFTPLALSISSKTGMKSSRAVLMPLAFGITTGSVFLPIGNPQNLLVALNSGMERPFIEFIGYLLIPTLVSLLAVYFFSRLFFKSDLTLHRPFNETKESLADPKSAISDLPLAKLSATILVLLIISFMVVEIFPGLQTFGLNLNNLAFIFGLVLLAVSPKRSLLLLDLNWSILIFFAGMFVVMKAVWDSGIGSILLSILPRPSSGLGVQSTGAIILNSVLLSQLLSNVPFVQLYSYEMTALGFSASHVVAWLALAAGGTLAGNLTVLGAVSNVIVLDSAESRHSKAFSFLEFMKYGSVMTIVTCLIFFVFLAYV